MAKIVGSRFADMACMSEIESPPAVMIVSDQDIITDKKE